jgi:two-component system response regulator HupR/HoxA
MTIAPLWQPPGPGDEQVFPPLPAGFVAGVSAAMRQVYREVAAIAPASFPVMIVGETGVGKEHLARLVAARSPRACGPFVAINCAAIPAELLEAELFGVDDGVATGVRRRRGSFQEADGGTLFLDEIGELAPHLQAKLLRVLQEKEVRPVGGRPLALDVRVVSATNSDLERGRRVGGFRDDLYYRLAGYVLRVPPLRQRRDDIPLLTRHFVALAAAEAGRPVPAVSAEAMEALVDCPWPGNVRQLQQEVRRLVYLGPEGGELRADRLSREVLEADVAELEREAAAGYAASGLDLDEHVERLERRLIRLALGRSGGSISGAARVLGLSRNGLKLKARRRGITL